MHYTYLLMYISIYIYIYTYNHILIYPQEIFSSLHPRSSVISCYSCHRLSIGSCLAWIRAKHFMPRPWLCQGMPRTRNMKPRRSRAVVFGFTPLTMATAVAVVNTQWDMFTCKKNSSKSLHFQAHRLRPKLFQGSVLIPQDCQTNLNLPEP